MIEAHYLTVGGVSSYIEIYGSGVPVLCLHTAGQSGVQWHRTAAQLATMGYQVVVPDLPGHGRSESHPDGPVTDLGLYAQWCSNLVEALRLHRPYVVGCSIGGKIALDLAVRMGAQLRGAVAMAADASPGRIDVRSLRRELHEISSPSRADRTYLGTLAAVGRSVPRKRAEAIANMHRREDPEVSVSDLIGWATHDVRSGFGAVVCPVHVVAGQDDPWVDPEQVAAIPAVRFTMLKGVGHYPMEEIEGFATLLHQWLEELGKGHFDLAGPETGACGTNANALKLEP